MTSEQIEAETARLLDMFMGTGRTGAKVEISHVAGPYPWRVTFYAFKRRALMIQGSDIADAFAKAWRWVGSGAVMMQAPAPVEVDG